MKRAARASRSPCAARFDEDEYGGTDICAYCAHPLSTDAETCSSCNRSLFYSFYRYAKPSSNLHVLWVLFAGLGQLYLISATLIYVDLQTLTTSLFHVLIAVGALAIAVGVYFRQWAAYLSTIPFLLVCIILGLAGLLSVEFELLEETHFAFQMIVSPLAITVGRMLNALQLAGALLAALWVAFFTGPDFVRDKLWLRAAVERGLTEPSDFFMAGKRYARRNMWATALLHWRRAVALSPTNAYFLRALGDAYVRLGFREQAVDALRSALQFTHDQSDKDKIIQKIAEVEKQELFTRV